MSRCYLLLLFFILTSCYSADRDNPLDPIRTQPVELLDVTFDDVDQTATLVWTIYQGIEPFQRYEIQRKEPGEDASIVGTVGTVADTSYVDDTILPGRTYTYLLGAGTQYSRPDRAQCAHRGIGRETGGADPDLRAGVRPSDGHGTDTVVTIPRGNVQLL